MHDEARPEVGAHAAEPGGRPLPAWSLPKDEAARIALPMAWPERVDREWAWGGSTGEGVRVISTTPVRVITDQSSVKVMRTARRP